MSKKDTLRKHALIINSIALPRTDIGYGSFLLLSLCFMLLSMPLSLEAKEYSPGSDYAEMDESQAPRYAILYDRLLLLEQKGQYLDAIRIIPKLYDEEFPVDVFYATLEKKRRQLLDAISKKEVSFSVGEEIHTYSSLRQLFTNYYLNKSDVNRQVVKISGALEFKRFYYLMLIEGHNQGGTLTQFNTQPVLTSADPWLVSAALFFDRERKRQTITPQGIIDRWQSRPDLWDEECTQQALRFLALQGSTAIKALDITNEDIRMEVDRLLSVP